MQANIKAVTSAAIQRCREAGHQVDAVEVAYVACLLEEQQAWSQQAAAAARPSAAAAEPEGAVGVQDAAGTSADGRQSGGQLMEPLQQRPLSLCSPSRLMEAAVAAMADRLCQELVNPCDAAAAATARLQVALQRSSKEQQDRVEAEQAQEASSTARLASAVAYKKVNMQAASLELYQSVFSQIVDYVCAALRLEARAAADAAARAQVSAAVESVLPLSGLAYFLTLPAQERMQQLESLAAISCGICLFNSHTGNAASPLVLAADTQLLQAQRLLADMQAAASQADQALQFHNSNTAPQHPAAAAAAAAGTASAVTAIAAAYLDSQLALPEGRAATGSDGGSTRGNGRACTPLGAALFCCQAAVALRVLCVDLAAGISCCMQLHHELLSVLTQAAQAAAGCPGAAVPKESVFPLFESGGHLYQALRGELRLLLVRGRLWEATCAALTAAAQVPGVPRVLGFTARRRTTTTSSTSSLSCNHSTSAATGASSTAAVVDLSSMPPGMEYLAPAAAVAAGGVAGGEQEGVLEEAVQQQQQQVLALAGLCPVSVAGSVVAGAAAAAAGVGGVVGGQAQVLVGSMARPEHGMIRYEGQLYGFSSPAALSAFIQGPELILDAVRQAAHNAPLLLHTLGLTAHHAASSTAGSMNGGAVRGFSSDSSAGAQVLAGRGSSAGLGRSSGGGGVAAARWRMPPLGGLLELLEAPLKVDAGTQTATHAVERLIDIDYEWNEWAMRRRIIVLANLRMKATHSSQTVNSCFRREGCSQTWLPKQAAVQTTVNKGSSIPRKLRHVTGLRGGPDTKMKVVSLELDVHGKGASARPAGHI